MEYKKEKEYHPGYLIRGADGRVTRLFRCECGTPVYRKDLTNDRYEIEMRPAKSERRLLNFRSKDSCEMKCPNPECKLTHLILDVKEKISTVENFKTTLL